MAQDYRPHPEKAQPGQPLKLGQLATYQDSKGNTWPALVCAILATSPDGKYHKVTAVRLEIQGSDDTVPFGFQFNAWLYRIETATIYWCPCTPGWPNAPVPPCPEP